MLPPLPLIDGCLFVDNSGFVDPMIACARKAQYSFLNRRISSAEGSALSFGTALHTCLEYRYSKYPNEIPDLLMEEEQSALLSAHFEQHPCPEDDFRTLNWAVECNRRYNMQYGVEPFQLLAYNNPIDCPYCEGKGGWLAENVWRDCIWCNHTGKRHMMVEMSFALPLFTWKGTLSSPGNPYDTHVEAIIPVFYTGRIDLPVLREGNLFIVDHKTSSTLGAQYWQRGKMSPQGKGYCWAFETLTGRKVAGYCLNVIRTKEPPLKLANGKQADIEKWWSDSLAREWFYLTSSDLSEWKTETIDMVERFFWHYSRGFFPREAGNPCTMWGTCPYYEAVCSLPIEDREANLSSGLFKDHTWTPLKEPNKQKDK